MDLIHSLPFFSTAITFVFAALVLNRYWHGRRMHSLMWGIGLVLYGLGTLAEAYLAISWSAFMLRLWYLTGAMLTAAWLGQGTAYLLIRKRGVADSLALGLLAASILAAVLIALAPVSSAGFHTGTPISTQYKEANLLWRNGLVILLTILFNIYGTVLLVGGALLSAWLFWRKRILRNRMLGNVILAAGAMLPASAGSLIALGLGDWLYVSELLGAALMFAGFWLATQAQPAEHEARAAARA